MNIYIYYFSYCENLESDQDSETKKFLEECIADPTLRDKLSVLNRTFKNRKRVCGYFSK